MPSIIHSPRSVQSLQSIVDQTPYSVIVKAAGLFCRKFPELSFLHFPTFITAPRKQELQIAAMLTLCQRFMPSSELMFTEEEYANYTQNCLSRVPKDPPSISTVHALLTMSMYEWGGGNGYGAWMYSGMANRMMQCLIVFMTDHVHTETDRQIQNRTFWGCFIMDRLVSCGRSESATLSLDKISTHLPSGDLDFAFGSSPLSRYTFRDVRCNISLSRSLGVIDTYYCVLIRGFDIWAQTHKFIIEGGRKQLGMNNPENCPWVHGSRWRGIYDTLEDWRSSQSDRLKYPSTPVAINVSLGQGESFAYVNLVYYISLLFLNREYIPFLPTLNSKPQGPVDPPVLPAVAPTNWWSDRARELFYCAEAITLILQELIDLESPLLTPFSGLCTFSAATMNLYVSAFPSMNLGRSPNATAMAKLNIIHLNEFKRLFKMGKRWWLIIESTQLLYQGAIADRARFHGKTRCDFLALEASMHDALGNSPIHHDSFTQGPSYPVQDKISGQSALDHSAAINLQELSANGISQPSQPQEPLEMDHTYDPWIELWPMCDEFDFNPT
ncbi:fungal specific transcription factor domain-containing protein [Penicillium taxi]|uniref:fungal specific transcription factor domain-containing protein n=1 Tax=Penicillium taxi TaxID=168475 RepID=UPI002544E638|nr:fungal specific transcription factor domain-containing protein [Penicillium taxi]KAJ5889068.1 fungal specific transcription factor domain-containing protein [Penicillium taxi]